MKKLHKSICEDVLHLEKHLNKAPAKFKRGDVVYGYAIYHKEWDYCKVESIHESFDCLFGYSLEDSSDFYKMDFETITPEYVTHSPLWQALR